MSKHISIMPDECMHLLDIKENGTYIDGTLGRGGHSRLILEQLKKGHLYAFDLDIQAIEESKENLKEYPNVTYIHDNFMNMNKYVKHVDGIFLDLGVSSPQFDEGERGFSYRFNGPLDMRMNKDDILSAYDVVNGYEEKELSRIFFEYGEEQFARPIARKIVAKRANKPLETTFELVEAIKEALPSKILNKKGHPAKKCFQAIRIEVNHELDSLKAFLNSFDEILNPDGTVVIITFHSLEDRMVKQKFKSLSTVAVDKRIALRPEEIKEAPYVLISRKALVASPEELENNPRAKSAKLRGIRKVGNRIWQK